MGTITATDWIPSCDAASPCGPPLTGAAVAARAGEDF